MKNYFIVLENSVKSPTIYITYIIDTTTTIRGKMYFAVAIQVIFKPIFQLLQSTKIFTLNRVLTLSKR